MGSARIPGVNKDTLNLSPTSKHVVFHSNGEYFRFNVLIRAIMYCVCRTDAANSEYYCLRTEQ